jgi:large subunit ribosomal protein L9
MPYRLTDPISETPTHSSLSIHVIPMSRNGRTVKRPFKRLPKGEHGGIQLLLIHNVEHLGKQGDIVEVKPGYARNYLLPQGLATIATEHHKRMVEKHREKLRAIELEKLKSFRELADDLAKQSITIEANANDEGHLYGSVGPHEIVASLKEAGFTLAADQIRLDGPLRELGLYTVKVHLHSEVDASLKVWVVPTAAEDATATT